MASRFGPDAELRTVSRKATEQSKGEAGGKQPLPDTSDVGGKKAYDSSEEEEPLAYDSSEEEEPLSPNAIVAILGKWDKWDHDHDKCIQSRFEVASQPSTILDSDSDDDDDDSLAIKQRKLELLLEKLLSKEGRSCLK